MADTGNCGFKITKEKVEEILGNYRWIVWAINDTENPLADEMRRWKISGKELEILSSVFKQETDIKSLAIEERNIEKLKSLKRCVDYSVARLKNCPKRGKELYGVITMLYTCSDNGEEITQAKALEMYNEWARKHNVKELSESTFKNRRRDGIEMLRVAMNEFLNNPIEVKPHYAPSLKDGTDLCWNKATTFPFSTARRLHFG